MIGTQQDPGIMVRVMSDLFVHSTQQGKQQGVLYKVSVSFLEVYNENIRDLLSDAEEYLDLREDPIKGPVVAGITEVEASSGDEIMSLLHQGNAKRSQAATAANEVSSRSHAVLQVLVEGRDRAPGVVANIKVGKLSLVDLAGSERAANTKNTGARLVEGANINRSLLALGNCINALGEKGNKGNFVPYRDSKLTRLLKDSLGGNCRTVMIANISSSESSFEETLNTLKYANRAKNIKTNVQRNVLNVNYHISEYVQLITNLRGEIKVLKDQISANNVPHHLEFGEPGIVPLLAPHSPFPNGRHGVKSPNATHISAMRQPSTPLQILRESMRSAASINGNEGRELVNNMRKRIVDNFQERMQLRRSLIELEDQNVQNSIEVSKRQLIVVQWADQQARQGHAHAPDEETFAEEIAMSAPSLIKEAYTECEQIRKAISKNNGMKKNIAKRLRLNEKEAESFRDELSNKITGEDRLELMELQYQVGRLELENMELEQHRIVHESIVKGKDLVIQKLRLQLAVKDKLISHQQRVLVENGLQHKIGQSQMLMLEQTIMGDAELSSTMAPPSPPRNISELYTAKSSSPQKLTQLNMGGMNGGNISNFDLAANNVPLSSRSQNDVDDLKADMAHRERRVGSSKSPKTKAPQSKAVAANVEQDADWEEDYSEFSDEYDEESDLSPSHRRGPGVGHGGSNVSSSSKKNSNNINPGSGKNTDVNVPIGILEGRAFGVNNNGKFKANPGNNNNAPLRNGRHYRATVDELPSYASDSKQPLRPAHVKDQQRKYQSFPDYAPPLSVNVNPSDVDGTYSDESDSQSFQNRAQAKGAKAAGNNGNGDKKMYSKASAERFELFRDNSEKGKLVAISNISAPSDLKLQLKNRQEQLQAQQRAQQQVHDQLHLSPGRGGQNAGSGFRNNAVAMIFPSDNVANSNSKDKDKENAVRAGGLFAGRNNSNGKGSNAIVKEKDEYNFDDFRIQGIGQNQGEHSNDRNDRKLRLQQHLQLSALPDRDYGGHNNNNNIDAYIDDSFESVSESELGRKMPQIRQAGLASHMNVNGAGLQIGGNNLVNQFGNQNNSNLNGVNDDFSFPNAKKPVVKSSSNVVLSKLKTKMAGVGVNPPNNAIGGVAGVILPSAGPAALELGQGLLGPVVKSNVVTNR
jgi:hypothetical protein